MSNKPVAYRLEWKSGDYCYYLPAEYEREINRDGARIRGLYTTPQTDHQKEPAVYLGRHFATVDAFPRRIVPESFRPLFLGHIIHEPR